MDRNSNRGRAPRRGSLWIAAIGMLILSWSAVGQGDQPFSGTVTAKDGQPMVGVKIFGNGKESATSDGDGHFRLEHPGAVIHFSKEGFQPRTFVIQGASADARSVLEAADNNLVLPACKQPAHGTTRVGFGALGIRFDIPKREVKFIPGKVDVDYVRHLVQPKNGGSSLELWFGPYAMSLEPDDQFFIGSEEFTQRNITTASDGVVGIDSRGRLRSGRLWRQAAAFKSGAIYRYATPDEARLFDSIIDSACWQPSPK